MSDIPPGADAARTLRGQLNIAPSPHGESTVRTPTCFAVVIAAAAFLLVAGCSGSDTASRAEAARKAAEGAKKQLYRVVLKGAEKVLKVASAVLELSEYVHVNLKAVVDSATETVEQWEAELDEDQVAQLKNGSGLVTAHMKDGTTKQFKATIILEEVK
jgi:hypothetical protein